MNNKVAVMQPYFFPYIGYFQLISSVDTFVFFDDVQFRKKSWMCRNRIITSSSNSPTYINAKTNNASSRSNLLDINLDYNWKLFLLNKLSNYSKAVFYDEVISLIESVEVNTNKLVDVNITFIKLLCDIVDINSSFLRFSELNYWFKEKPNRGTWGYEIAKKLKADTYINSPGGEDFIFKKTFKDMELAFIQPKMPPYKQLSNKWEPGLSILDMLFNCGIESVKHQIENYNINYK